MRIALADTVHKLTHTGYIGFPGKNPNIEIVPVDEADYVWFCCWGDGEAVREDLVNLALLPKPLISVTLGDWDYTSCLPKCDIARHFSTATKTWARCVPYACQNQWFPNNSDRPILASFRGSFNTNPNREKLLSVACKDIIVERQEWWGLTDQEKTPHYQRHFDLVDHSRFTFCPRGFGQSTTRLHEAILHHSIPIMIEDPVRLFDQDIITRPPITPERMLGEASSAQVIYRSDIVHPRHQANFRVFDPLDFLAEVSAHIPDPHEKTTLFYGWYSNPACAVHADRRTRGYRNQHGLLAKAEAAEPVPGTDDGAPLEVRRSCLRRAQARRARLIRQVYEVDPLLCSRCGGTMKVIAVIERPAVVRQILDHLGLSTAAPRFRAPPDPPREWSYEPLLDGLPVPDPLIV